MTTEVRGDAVYVNGVRAIGGPVRLLICASWEYTDFIGGTASILEMERKPSSLRVSFLIRSASSPDQFKLHLEAVGVEARPHPTVAQGFLGIYRWRMHGGLWAPQHWIDRGLPASLALYRIFGSDERLWPAPEPVS